MKWIWLLSLLAACGGGGNHKTTNYPVRPEGCEVTMYREAPIVQTVNIGAVVATCADTFTIQQCERTLKDEVCKLGGDVVWGVDSQGSREYDKIVLRGRAAHTK